MAITNYLVHFLTEDTYNSKKSELRNDAVAFVKDATIIHTHGTDYYCGKSEVALKTDLNEKANVNHTHDAMDIVSGTLSISRIPTGTSASTVAVGNHTHSQYLTNADLSSYVTDSELSSAIEDITPSSINAATEDHKHVASDITALTGYTEDTSTTTLTSTMTLNQALASLQNQIQDKASSSLLDDYALKTEIPNISNLATKTELAGYLPLTGGDLTGSLAVETIQAVENLYGTNNFTIYGGPTGSDTLTFTGGQKSVVLSQSGFTYDGSNILTEDNWTSYINIDTDAVNKAGATNQSSLKLFLVGARNQAAGEFTYSNTNVYTQSGQLYATRMNATNGFYETSDATLKNFKDDVKALEIVSKIPTKYFTWKKDELDEKLDPELHIGTSAQEIQKLYPDLVTADENGILSVDYARLSIIALAAIKELKAELNELKNK